MVRICIAFFFHSGEDIVAGIMGSPERHNSIDRREKGVFGGK